MGFFDDLAMGVGLKDRDDDYYERTAQTLGRESQGGSAQREAQYRGSMGMNNGATVGGGQLDKRGGLLPFMEGGGTIGAIARGIGGKGGGKTEQASNSQDLGLGGLQSFLGTRGPAAQSELGNAQMQATLTDNLPGYFDPATREYVPWYVDMFNGGGFNSAGGEDAQAEQGGAMNAQSAIGDMRPQQRANPLEPFGGSGPNIPESQLGPFGGSGPAINQNNQQSGQLYSPINADQYDYPSYAQAPPKDLASQTTSNLPARPFGGILSPPAEAAPTTSSKDSFLDRLLSGEIAASNRATLNGDSEGVRSDQQIKDYQSNYDERQRNMPYNLKYGVFYNEMKNSGADINNPDVFDQWLKQRGL